jgi:riboflavin kinase / FMN adenylyltransferase
MQVLHGMEGLRSLPPGAVMTIGNFDGVHRGHQCILRKCHELKSPGSPVVVVTFEPHPLTVLRPAAVAPRLTPPEMKQEFIAGLDVDFYVVLPPTQEVLNLTAEDFWKLLRDDVRPSHLIEGPDFTFGKNRGGDVRKLAEWAAGSGMQFCLISPVQVALMNLQLAQPSSSLIRWLVTNGRVRDAAICLGRPYTLRGEVIKGFGRGRTIGVPTANLGVTDQLVPLDGVYAGRCRIGSDIFPAAVSIGDMPTFGGGPRQIEAHLLGFDGDLYGRRLDVELLDWLRDQLKFTAVDELKVQIGRDITATKSRSSVDPSVPIAV